MHLGRITEIIQNNYKYMVKLCKIYEILKVNTTLGLRSWSWGQKWRRPRAESNTPGGFGRHFWPQGQLLRPNVVFSFKISYMLHNCARYV